MSEWVAKASSRDARASKKGKTTSSVFCWTSFIPLPPGVNNLIRKNPLSINFARKRNIKCRVAQRDVHCNFYLKPLTSGEWTSPWLREGTVLCNTLGAMDIFGQCTVSARPVQCNVQFLFEVSGEWRAMRVLVLLHQTEDKGDGNHQRHQHWSSCRQK